MRQLWISLFLLVATGSQWAFAKQPKWSSDSVQKIANCIVSRPYNTYSQSKKRYITTRKCHRNRAGVYRCKDTRHGIFAGAWRSMLWDYRANQCIRSVMKKGHSKVLRSLASIAGKPLYAPSRPGDKKINRYNPALITWLKQWIPRPSDELGDYEYQSIYNVVFRRFIRMNAYVYLYLTKGKGKGLVTQYIQAHVGPQRATGQKQRKIRASIAAKLNAKVRDVVASRSFSGAGDMGLFWSRRIAGGSANAVWTLLKHIMTQYDANFLRTIQTQTAFPTLQMSLPTQPLYKRYIWWPSEAGQMSAVFAQTNGRIRYQFKAGMYSSPGYNLPDDMTGKGKEHVAQVTLEGIEKKPSVLLCDTPTNDAIFFEKVSDLIVRRLVFRYKKPTKGAPCQKQVLRLKQVKRAWIDQIVLDTPCPVGILIEDSEDIVISRIKIKTGTTSPIKAIRSQRLWLSNNTMAGKKISCKGCSTTATPHSSWTYATNIATKLKPNK